MTKREKWLAQMLKIADPVIRNLSQEKLREQIPQEFHADRNSFILLEAFARTVNGLAPWLELEELSGKERELQEKYRRLIRAGIAHATDPTSKDYMDFGQEWGQPLVDAGFLAHAIVRAPQQMFYVLEDPVKRNLISALKKSRKINPCPTNWLFFSAMVETALYVMGEKDYDLARIDYAVRMFEGWYKGDGVYGDGAEFRWDYYNSYVIQPMYVDILRVMEKETEEYRRLRPVVEERAAKYASVLERMIAPDGTYPILGRSVVYRFGTFQMLGQAALEHLLPTDLKPAQIRCALTAVLDKMTEAETLFDAGGWLRPGIYGYQPELAEFYISTGSLYLCMAFFLPLGLPAEDAFWSEPSCAWTAKKIWQYDSSANLTGKES